MNQKSGLRLLRAIGILTAVGQGGIAIANDDAKDRVVLDLNVTGVSASTNIDAADEANSGASYRARLGWDRDSGANHIDVDLTTSYFAYEDPDRVDRFNNRLAVGYGRDLSQTVSLSARIDHSTHSVALDSQDVSQTQVRSLLQWDDRANRVRLIGSWRWREYKTGAGGNANGPALELEYRRRLPGNARLQLEGRWEKIDTSVASKGYERFTLNAGAVVPLSKKLDLELNTAWKDWTYRDRFVDGIHRNDRSITPDVGLNYAFARNWQISATAAVQWRTSNDPARDKRIERGYLTLQRRFYLYR